jgi:hypothetical protein
MNKTGRIWLVGTILTVAAVSCSLPTTPTPFAIPTPNLTMTALFRPTETIPPSITPPVVQTATPVPATSTAELPEATATTLPNVTGTPNVTELPDVTATATKMETEVPEMRPGVRVQAAFLEESPTIDGDLDEWDIPRIFALDVVFGAANHSGIDDLSAEAMVGWDNEYLYLAAEVEDDLYAQNATGKDLFKGDSLEIVLDTDVPGDYNSSVLSFDDFQLGISPGSPVGTNMEAYLWIPGSISGPRSQVQIGASTTADGYLVEVAIPWEVFKITPASGDHYGFAFSVSDNDNAVKDEQQSMVSNVSTRFWANPTTWGDLTLLSP